MSELGATRGGAARARGASRGRAESLSPPRRLRAHAGGVRTDDRADRAGRRRGERAARAPSGNAARATTRAEVDALLAEPLADQLTRGDALRWGALLHDAAKPLTREIRPADGRVTFIGHDVRGAELARAILERLRASERLRAHVAALVRHHLRLGFLVHEPQPLSRRTVFGYLRACSPVEVDVTLLSAADRLATRGDRAQESIDAHLRVARGLLPMLCAGAPRVRRRRCIRGDELAGELGIPLGPRVGRAARRAGRGAVRGGAVDARAIARLRARPPCARRTPARRVTI